MNGTITARLILKDWRLNRMLISLTLAIGMAALLLVCYAGETGRLLGGVWFFVALIFLGSMLPGGAIINERKKQTLAFIMSLPVSSLQYTIAKIVSIWAMFLIPWLGLLMSALIVIQAGHKIPRGVIPMLLILAMLPVVAFCLSSAAALISESEGWLIAVTIVFNSSYWFVWYLLARIPTITDSWKGPVAVWSPAARMVLSSELGIIVVILALTLFIQSRKRDFI